MQILKDFYIYRHAWISCPHFKVRLNDNQCNDLLKKGGWLVRNTYDFDQKKPSDFWYIIKDSFGGMEEHSSNDRNKIRRAFNRFDYRRIEKQLIIDCGLEIVMSVNKNYVVKDWKMDEKGFQELLNSWKEEENEFWGAFDLSDGRFVGFAVVKMFDTGCFCVLLQ